MPHHHNPMDPRDPSSAAFYYTFIDKNGGQRPGDGDGCTGCGCALAFMAFALGVLLAMWR